MIDKIREKLVEGQIFQIINHKVYDFFQRIIKKDISSLYHFFNTAAKAIDHGLAYFPRRKLNRTTTIDHNTIMFITYQGDYTCNPKAIAEEIIKQNLPYNLIWVVKNKDSKKRYPKKLKLIRRGYFEFYKSVASAKVIVDNTHNLPRMGVPKKDGQYLLQTWHGSLGIKCLDGDVVMNKTWKRIAEFARKKTDYCISNSQFETDVFHTSYWKDVPILLYGHARNDILFTENERSLNKIRKKVYSFLGLGLEKKVLLYAPTHKDNVGESMFQLDYNMLKKALEQRFGGEWVILLRFHSRLKQESEQWVNEKPHFVIDATQYEDMQELMLVTDVGVTDYSSWIFDYILLKRPGFILADDIDQFETQRSFYYPLETTPFKVSTNNEDLKESILNFDEESYLKDIDAFLADKGCIEDGYASERIVKKIEELIES